MVLGIEARSYVCWTSTELVPPPILRLLWLLKQLTSSTGLIVTIAPVCVMHQCIFCLNLLYVFTSQPPRGKCLRHCAGTACWGCAHPSNSVIGNGVLFAIWLADDEIPNPIPRTCCLEPLPLTSYLRFYQIQVLRQGFESRELLWKVVAGNTSRELRK
jgi:hypothetical protein